MIAGNGTGKQEQVTGKTNGYKNGSGEGRRGTTVDNGEMVLTGKRRQFSKAYKRRILAEAEACQYGELGALLRREGLYSSNLSAWRRELAAGKVTNNEKQRKREKKEIERLQKENARLQKELKKAEAIITAQKKLAELIDMMNEPE